MKFTFQRGWGVVRALTLILITGHLKVKLSANLQVNLQRKAVVWSLQIEGPGVTESGMARTAKEQYNSVSEPFSSLYTLIKRGSFAWRPQGTKSLTFLEYTAFFPQSQCIYVKDLRHMVYFKIRKLFPQRISLMDNRGVILILHSEKDIIFP